LGHQAALVVGPCRRRQAVGRIAANTVHVFINFQNFV
jgi:hypothetical protein